MIDNVSPCPEKNESPELLDVSAHSLEALTNDNRSVLQNSLRRVREAANDQDENYAAFGNIA